KIIFAIVRYFDDQIVNNMEGAMRVIRRAVALLVAASAMAVSAQPYPDVTRSSLYVPVRDGTKLAVNIYRPANGAEPVAERLPVIFVFTPYRARYRDEQGKVVEAA